MSQRPHSRLAIVGERRTVSFRKTLDSAGIVSNLARRCFWLIYALAIVLPVSVVAQIPPQPGSTTPSDASVPNEESLTLKRIIPYILEDQKALYWDFPRSLARGKNWKPTTAFLLGTGVLIAIDQFESPYFRRTSTYQSYNSGFSSTNTSLMILAVPTATYAWGSLRKNHYASSTALLTGEAIADAEIAAELLKVTTRRARPNSIPSAGNFADTWQDSRTITGGGFPSGHTIAAFSMATVMSRRYGTHHRWVPWVAYGLASTIGFSRVTLSAHNISDVAAGAALGYAISRFVTQRKHGQ